MGPSTYAVRVAVAILAAASFIVVTPTEGLATGDTAPPSTDTAPPEPSADDAAPAEPDTTAPEPPPRPGTVPTFTPVRRIDVQRKLVFPIVGKTKYYAGFGDCRDNCTREHFGVDILTYGWKGLPVVAAQDGIVTRVTYDQGKAGCSVRIKGRDRWETRYVHLNNDTPGTDDGSYPCPAPGIDVGTEVTAGQIIGWVGDSGNAEHTVPNLHFELRTPGGYPVDPYRSLRAARRVSFEWLTADPVTATSTLTAANWGSATSSMVVVVPADEASLLTRNGSHMPEYDTPILVVDPLDPQVTVDAIDRLGARRVVVRSNQDTTRLEEVLGPRVEILDTIRFPDPPSESTPLVPDATEVVTVEHDPPDRFITIVSGAIDRISRRSVDPYERYVAEHLVVSLRTDRWARRNLGIRPDTKPSRYADRAMLWWMTGDGWVGTPTTEDPPAPGYAYVTEKRVTSWTLAYLASLSRSAPTPLWWGDGAR